eukprot:TRINITY_DN2845_c0_g1_i1.p1 TRINITY_DN2845_c0_g1~~TRINITY_DN2845_c0_g1_i1.p1  ORF type:complete len:171 (-),score=31.52 TRINITY_DN2845_c0_g1_i1:477-953(-)
MKIILLIALIVVAATCQWVPPHGAGKGYRWDSCGTRYDRLRTNALTFSTSNGYKAGSVAHLHAEGPTMLHVPLKAGAWQVRLYELGDAHPMFTTFGDVMKAVKFDDPEAPTAYKFDAEWTMPPSKTKTGEFIASMIVQDQQHALYSCWEVNYNYTTIN